MFFFSFNITNYSCLSGGWKQNLTRHKKEQKQKGRTGSSYTIATIVKEPAGCGRRLASDLTLAVSWWMDDIMRAAACL